MFDSSHAGLHGVSPTHIKKEASKKSENEIVFSNPGRSLARIDTKGEQGSGGRITPLSGLNSMMNNVYMLN
jgi:hypothetical protein